MRRIAVYGKGGIGKSTISTHLAAAWAASGLRVMLVGCDPKADSTRALLGHRSTPLLDRYEELVASADSGGASSSLRGLIEVGFAGVRCVEIGGPEPGVGCAGRGISMALELMEQSNAFADLDVVVFDILGDIVCGGFAVPMRLGFAREVYIVTSGEYSALYAANNICRGMRSLQATLGGIIANCRGLPAEKQLVETLAHAVGSTLIGTIPRSGAFPRSAMVGKTIIESVPESAEAGQIVRLSQAILDNQNLIVPSPLDDAALDELAAACLDSGVEW